jgi:hypothetical protein
VQLAMANTSPIGKVDGQSAIGKGRSAIGKVDGQSAADKGLIDNREMANGRDRRIANYRFRHQPLPIARLPIDCVDWQCVYHCPLPISGCRLADPQTP